MAMSTGVVPSARGLAFENFTVQRASRVLLASLADSTHSGGMGRLDLLLWASVLRCFGAAIRLASTI